jgi:hypothetical protein
MSADNQFVSKFTVTEAVAVQQLKDALPNLLKEAFGTDDVYPLWGVPLDKSSNDERIKVVLVKFLRARYEESFASFSSYSDSLLQKRDPIETWSFSMQKSC